MFVVVGEDCVVECWGWYLGVVGVDVYIYVVC